MQILAHTKTSVIIRNKLIKLLQLNLFLCDQHLLRQNENNKKQKLLMRQSTVYTKMITCIINMISILCMCVSVIMTIMVNNGVYKSISIRIY